MATITTTFTGWNSANKEGVDVTSQYTPLSSTATIAAGNYTPEYPAPPFAYGEHVLCENGCEFLFCFATAALPQYACLSIDQNFNASLMTNTLANNLTEVGFAQFGPVTSGNAFWAAIRGSGLSFLSKGAVSKNTALRISSSAGILTNATTSFALITGVVTSSSYASTSTIGRVGIATWPRAVQ